MDLRRVKPVILVLGVWAVCGGSAGAQLVTGGESIIGKLNPFHPFDPHQPVTVSELCKRLDCIAEQLRDDGLVVVKQPDVFSQARLTRFRNDFDNQMSADLGNFHLVLAARINRLDAATTTQTTALSAALSAPGTTNMTATDPTKFIGAVSGANSPFATGGTSLFGSQIEPKNSAFGALTLAPNTLAGTGANTSAIGLGVEPTVYLDEKKRFLEHLNQIRRISLGPDQNDSSGYGLYLVRLPVSITPGECTYNGHGAELSVTVEHEFTPEFLPTTFQSLVVNDLIDQLGPFLYEAVRSGFFEEYLKPVHDGIAKQRALTVQSGRQVALLLNGLAQQVIDAALGRPTRSVFRLPVASSSSDPFVNPLDPVARPLEEFILRQTKPLTGDPANDQQVQDTLASRLTVLADALAKVQTGNAAIDGSLPQGVAALRQWIAAIRRGDIVNAQLQPAVREYVRLIVRNFVAGKPKPTEDITKKKLGSKVDSATLNMELFRPFLEGLYQTALPDDVMTLDDLLAIPPAQRTAVTSVLAQNNADLNKLKADRLTRLNNLNLPSVRTAKELYPIAPRDLLDFFLTENMYLLAKEVKEASRVKEIRAVDVRNYLRHTLGPAYTAMSHPTPRAPEQVPPLADDEFLREVSEAISQRQFVVPVGGEPSRLDQLNEVLYTRVGISRDNIQGRAIAALCWAIAVDAALLDEALLKDAHKVFTAEGIPCESLEGVHLYYPNGIPNDQGKVAFQTYVRHRWPIITFSLDPVTDQQNIADSFNLKRDLQLALSYAFSTGQIGFNQLNTFRRQIEQSSDSIALNRTVTGFAHGNDNFGFRFTPRFQNPPNQRTNIGVITSQLIGGGPGPDYQIKKSKLEPGMRELTAVLLIPTFLPVMRMNVASNWFKLNDPEHLVFHTSRLMEEGRKVQEIRQALIDICSAQRYRGADLRVFQTKLAQLEAMLPMQSRVIQLPFENSASGFDLFSEGATALVPELTGYSGVDVVRGHVDENDEESYEAAARSPAATAPSGSTPAVTITSQLAGPTTTTALSVTAGKGSIADIFVFGKYISLLDTRVIAGGRSAAFEILSREVVHVQIPANVIPTTTEDGKTYIEVFLSTPNGISNSVLVPYKRDERESAHNGYELDEKSHSIDVFYQWFTTADLRTILEPTYDPGSGKALRITWDDQVGLAPKRIRARFTTTVNGQKLVFFVSADASNKGDYLIDLRKFTVTLLRGLQDILVAPAAAPTPLTFSVAVQPFIPNDTENLRVRIEPKELKSKLTVNMQPVVTGVNALPGVAPTDPTTGAAISPRSPAQPGAFGPAIAQGRPVNDLAVVRTAQSASLPQSLSLPQPSPALNAPGLLAPNVTSEAEQVGKLLTGQPLNLGGTLPPFTVPTAPPQVSGTGTAPGPPATTTAATVATASNPSTQPIIVMPAPVVVIPPKPQEDKKHGNSRLHNSRLFKNLSNRINQALPPGLSR